MGMLNISMMISITNSTARRTTLTVLELKETKMMRWQMSTSNRMISFKCSTMLEITRIQMHCRIDKSQDCFIIATFKCKIPLKTGPIKDRCLQIDNLRKALKKKSMIPSLKRSLSSSRRSLKLERIVWMDKSSTQREEMVPLEDKLENLFQMFHQTGSTN